ncbi:glycosyltransferase family 2 protein [Flavobacterium saccharophilum]|uniref:Glycosyltransferase involved in cell wall bisynthesis n=1 Tax=Flavobacterium saccharophilum TaxID=29534 RepID=A0A1M7K7L8_9FLAO|nr:glycosyltransferase [Flavobacterium saccharophilum]SHM61299.1 Glycosyltransferase involved in cell wall bisynthesis [Flavobacterium saccharophilum]
MIFPLISIIIPTYNRAHLINITLDSILAQTYQNWECIIIDDGSSDNTAELLQKYQDLDSRFQYYKRPDTKKKGPNSCRNFGFEKSKGEFINWFDSDDILFEDSIALRIANFNQSIDGVVAKCEIFDSSNGLKIAENTILSTGNMIKDYFLGNMTFYVSGPIWRRSFLEKQQELFDEEIRYLDDWDFNLRMLYQSPNIKFLDIPVFRYRFHAFSLSKQIDHSNMEEFKSECLARNKHLKLIPKAGFKNIQIRNFIIKRHKVFLKEALVKKDKNSFWFFLKLITLQIRFKKF